MPEFDKYDKGLTFFGLFLGVTFPVLSGIPFVGYLAETVVCFFLILYTLRRQGLYALITIVGSLAIAIGSFGIELIVFALWGKVVVPALVLGWLMSSGARFRNAFMATLIAASAGSLILFLAEKELFYAAFDQAQNWFQTGLPEANGESRELAEMMIGMMEIIKRLMPSMLILSAVMQIFVGWLVAVFYLNARGEYVPQLVSFYHWKMPDYLIYPTGGLLLLRLAAPEPFKIVADNALLFMGLFYALFGFSLLEYYLKKLRLSIFMRMIFYIAILLLHIPGLILAALAGFFDSYFDFRKVRAKLIG